MEPSNDEDRNMQRTIARSNVDSTLAADTSFSVES
jgi:hypothetical protein